MYIKKLLEVIELCMTAIIVFRQSYDNSTSIFSAGKFVQDIILHLITPCLCFQTLNNLWQLKINHLSTQCPFWQQVFKCQDDDSNNLTKLAKELCNIRLLWLDSHDKIITIARKKYTWTTCVSKKMSRT
jgi:hypothetical protein